MKRILKGMRLGMKEFGGDITILINSVLLGVVYMLGVGITSIIAKAFGKKFLKTNILKEVLEK